MASALYFGDNLHVLRHYIDDESVDLIYLDPPFNSNSDYNLVFSTASGRGHRAQIQAFEDTWSWGEEAQDALDDIRAKGGSCAAIVKAFHQALGQSKMMAYIVMMAVRLDEMHRVLKPTGSLYLHCDPTAQAYLKIILDNIFGAASFRNEISWRRQSAHNDAKQGRKQLGNVRDTLLFYTKSNNWTWNTQYTPYDQDYIDNFYKHVDEETGRRYRLSDITGPGGAAKGNPSYEVMGVTRYWRFSKAKMSELLAAGRIVQTKPGAVPAQKRYLDEMPGVALQNDWGDIRPAAGKESLGYPTQKPLALLERIISLSSNEGDVILDPFCGCGTAVHAAHRMGRRWIGVDITHVAIQIISDRLIQKFPTIKFATYGQPRDLAGANRLAELDKYQFQWWATWLCGGQPSGGQKKGADGGIDGTLEFATERGRQDWGIISVKGGKTVKVDMVRELDAVVRHEEAAMGVLITLAEPTREMEKWAISAGHVVLAGVRYRRIQLRTIEQLLAGDAIDCPYLLTTVQEAPAKSQRGAGSRVRLSPADTLAQRNILLPIAGGKAAPRQGRLALDEPTPIPPRSLNPVRRRHA